MSRHFLVFDVESIGLHGQAYAVGGCIVDIESGYRSRPFRYACDPSKASGADSDREWCTANIPPIEANCEDPKEVRDLFWSEWIHLKLSFPGLSVAAECGWPVEANFLEACIKDGEELRRFAGPYPLHEIASFMAAAGMDPMATYDRSPEESPQHCPQADAMQSARLLLEAMAVIHNQTIPA